MSMTHKELNALKPGDSLKVGALFGNVCPDEIHLDFVEKVDGVMNFDATYLGVPLGTVAYNNGKWGWAK